MTTDQALAQTPTENASETPRLRETQTPDTATEGVCCQQRSCSALGLAGDVEGEGFRSGHAWGNNNDLWTSDGLFMFTVVPQNPPGHVMTKDGRRVLLTPDNMEEFRQMGLCPQFSEG